MIEDILVKIDGPVGCISLEIWGNRSKSKSALLSAAFAAQLARHLRCRTFFSHAVMLTAGSKLRYTGFHTEKEYSGKEIK